ncbi:hypothetical protein [Bradyrhizobium sp. 131]|uniref:hypothetical protein n=2 Tax=unclassified Bradyrhizobium TaxID=2631580 RepID=UPI001FFF9D40|nr:hypothetical protein [Bradyrhizobium sp. 131]UPK23421.1 hypothetical protein IVA73_38100 [Bradyrhizobium sp. 131]
MTMFSSLFVAGHTTRGAQVAFVTTVLFSGIQIILSAKTLSLARYPVKQQYRGIWYELNLLYLLLKKHTLGIVLRQPLTQAEFKRYDRAREVAKNIFISFLFFPLSLVVIAAAAASFARDPGTTGTDYFLLFISIVTTIVQLRIYDSERRIYNGKAVNPSFSNAPEEVSVPPRNGVHDLGSGLQQESAMSSKPIYERIDPKSFAKTASEASKNIAELIEADKRKTEDALVKSKWSNMFEISGAPAKDKK